MSSPQEPARRHRQKIRRSKQLAAWRGKNPQKELPGADAKAASTKPAVKAAEKAEAKKAEPKKAPAKAAAASAKK